jgi:methyltransferase-like protein/cyclopropane fatty-acyl-phospholipid synthase-like methyltransferase
MTETPLTSYEELPYSRNPFYPTHPDCLATVAALHGLGTAPVTRCRVLELGCAGGGNLVPMAAELPDSEFVGIDLSPRQIAEGQELVDALGLRNITLRPLSILDVDASFGTFDYIISHGVYSWVPAEVQERILQISRDHLAANGVAYVSYNTYPGWHLRGMVRDMLGYHARQFGDVPTRVRQTRAFLDFLQHAVRDPEGTYGQYVRKEAEMLERESDTYLFHEHLEDVNCPLWFHEFAGRAGAHGLQYLAEAQPWAVLANVPAQFQHIVDGISRDRIAREQYLDFLGGRIFRRSLLCHANVAIAPEPSAEVVPSLRATALVKPVNPLPDLRSDAPEQFQTRTESVSLTTNKPSVKAALTVLYEVWPRSMPFDAVCGEIGRRLECETDREELAHFLLNCYAAQMVELHVHEPLFVLAISDRPIGSPPARVLALNERRVPNLRHRSVELDDFDRLVFCHLDGSRDRAALLDMLAESVAEGVLALEGAPADVPLREALDAALTACLRRLAGHALLVG